MSAPKNVTVNLPADLAHAFARVRRNEVRLYDRKTKRPIATVSLDQCVGNGDTIDLPSFTFTAA